MTGLAVAMLLYGLACTGALVVVLGAVDDLRAALDREKALRLAADELLDNEQLAVRDIAVATLTPVRDVAARLERALYTSPRGPVA